MANIVKSNVSHPTWVIQAIQNGLEILLADDGRGLRKPEMIEGDEYDGNGNEIMESELKDIDPLKIVYNIPIYDCFTTKCAYQIFNSIMKSTLKEISEHIGIQPMYTPAEIETDRFYDIGITQGMENCAVNVIHGFIDFINDNIMKDSIKSCIEATSYAMPKLFMSVSDEVLSNYDYSWNFNLTIKNPYEFFSKIGITGGLCSKGNYKEIAIKYIGEIYKNLIKYGFSVVADIKEKVANRDRLVVNEDSKNIEKNETKALRQNINQENHGIEELIIGYMV